METAVWLFEQYGNNEIGLRSLAESLNGRGVPGPTGGKWHIGTIREILKNEKYFGDFVWGKRRMGKYFHVAGGEIKPRDIHERQPNGDGKVVRNPKSAWNIKPDAHPGLISRELFDKVQRKLNQRRRRTTPGRKKNIDRYLLTGLLYCGHCGAKMYGTRKSRRKNGKTYEWEKYICSTYHTQGKTECNYHTVDQNRIVKVLSYKLRDAILAGERLDDLRDRIRQVLNDRESDQGTRMRCEHLQKRIEILERKISTGSKRLLQVPDELFDVVSAQLSDLIEEKERLKQELAAAESLISDVIDLDVAVEHAMSRFGTFAEDIEKVPRPQVRELMNQMVSRIDLHFDHVNKGTRIECPFSHGIVTLRPDPLLYRLVNRGDWI